MEYRMNIINLEDSSNYFLSHKCSTTESSKARKTVIKDYDYCVRDIPRKDLDTRSEIFLDMLYGSLRKIEINQQPNLLWLIVTSRNEDDEGIAAQFNVVEECSMYFNSKYFNKFYEVLLNKNKAKPIKKDLNEEQINYVYESIRGTLRLRHGDNKI